MNIPGNISVLLKNSVYFLHKHGGGGGGGILYPSEICSARVKVKCQQKLFLISVFAGGLLLSHLLS